MVGLGFASSSWALDSPSFVFLDLINLGFPLAVIQFGTNFTHDNKIAFSNYVRTKNFHAFSDADNI